MTRIPVNNVIKKLILAIFKSIFLFVILNGSFQQLIEKIDVVAYNTDKGCVNLLSTPTNAGIKNRKLEHTS